jgi:hypothetical protein
MRRRRPGLLGRFGGIVAVDANRFWQRIIKSPSAEADAVIQAIPRHFGKGKASELSKRPKSAVMDAQVRFP